MTRRDELDFDLYRDLSDESSRSRNREAALASILVHVCLLIFLLLSPQILPAPPHPAPRRTDRVTLLFPPPEVLTQKEPNRTPPSKLFVGAPEVVRPPKLAVPKTAPSAPPPEQPKGNPTAEEKPPQMTPAPVEDGSLLAQTAPPPAAPLAPPPEPPRIVVEEPRRPPAGGAGNTQAGTLLPQRQGSVVEGTIRDLARGSSGSGLTVGDGASGGLPDGFTVPNRGNIGSNLELMSDPMGVDFKPYLTQILAAVRRNWYSVIPESARLGIARGRVSIQFMIVKNGNVSKLVIASGSGLEALDRAAVAGISASNPFPPLPPEFRGDLVKLQFTFLYNVSTR